MPSALYSRLNKRSQEFKKPPLSVARSHGSRGTALAQARVKMKIDQETLVIEQPTVKRSVRLNHHTGWFLMLTAFATAAWITPWSLNREPRAVAVTLGQITALEAQTMIAILGIFQLAMPQLSSNYSRGSARSAARLTASGSLLAGIGYALALSWSATAWLIVVGGMMDFAALMHLMNSPSARQNNRGHTIVLTMLCFGVLLIVLMAMAPLQPRGFPFAALGPDDGFTLRTLRLARVAALALPVLTLLYPRLANRSHPCDRVARTGRLMMLCGTAGMSTILTGAGLIAVDFKFLLAVPAVAVFAAVLCALCVARRHAVALETWGWLLIAMSMAAGLLMSLYAFATPWVMLSFPGEYNDSARHLIRVAHVDAIVLGFVAIFIAREIHPLKRLRTGASLLVAGSTITVGMPLLLLLTTLSTAMLSIGPALVSAAVIFCIAKIENQSEPVLQGGNS
jgi:hypothetical protein